MSDKPPSTAKEALVAVLLGDVHTLLARLEKIDTNTKATTVALNEATQQYRDQVDGMVARLRSEAANVITQATAAMQKALSVEVLKRTRRDWYTAVFVSSCFGALVASVIGALAR
jgi:hypothetical protein